MFTEESTSAIIPSIKPAQSTVNGDDEPTLKDMMHKLDKKLDRVASTQGKGGCSLEKTGFKLNFGSWTEDSDSNLGKVRSAHDFLTYSYQKVKAFNCLNVTSNEIDGLSNFDDSSSIGTKQNALRSKYIVLNTFLVNFKIIFYLCFWCQIGSTIKYIDACPSMYVQESINERMFTNLWCAVLYLNSFITDKQ